MSTSSRVNVTPPPHAFPAQAPARRYMVSVAITKLTGSTSRHHFSPTNSGMTVAEP
jgi:hypothetical protein